MNRSLVYIGHLSLLITAILSIVFYKERVIWVDPGQQVFEMINEGGYKIFVGRYSMYINQTIPLIAIKLGLPLKAILISYSLSFVLVYYICFLLSTYLLKNPPAGLAIAFVPLLIREAFGHSISEAWLGIAYSGLFYALINYYDEWRNKGSKYVIIYYLLSIVLILINFFIHPITLFTLAFAIGFTYFNRGWYKKPSLYILSLVIIVMYLLKFLLPSHPHEDKFFDGIRRAPELIPHLLQLPIFQFIKIHIFDIYLPLAILHLFAGIFYLQRKTILTFVYSIGFCLFYLIIASLAFYKGDGAFAIESRLIPLTLICIIPIAEIAKTNSLKIIVSLMFILFGIQAYMHLVRSVKQNHTTRIEFYRKMLDESKQFDTRKFYCYYPPTGYTPVNSWGSAAETLLLSSLDGNKESRTIRFVYSSDDITSGMNYWPCVFLWTSWYKFYPEDYLNKKYFDLKCTSYIELKYPI